MNGPQVGPLPWTVGAAEQVNSLPAIVNYPLLKKVEMPSVCHEQVGQDWGRLSLGPSLKQFVLKASLGNCRGILPQNNLARILVFPKAEKHWLAQSTIPRPLRKLD